MVTRRKADFSRQAEFRSRACQVDLGTWETSLGAGWGWRVLCAEREWSPRWDTGVQGSPLLLCWGPGSHTFTYTQSFLFSEMASRLSISHGVSQDLFSAHFSEPFVLLEWLRLCPESSSLDSWIDVLKRSWFQESWTNTAIRTLPSPIHSACLN